TLFGVTALAQNVSGSWKMSYTMPDGYKHESTLDLRREGEKLAGKISSKRGTVELADGSVSGKDIIFTVVRRGNGDELKVDFSGTIEDETMKLKMEYRDHDPVELTARRVAPP
ncbi:MAG: hypothetical protein ACRD7E_03970, partial [Bryobacteraceae bacterium]